MILDGALADAEIRGDILAGVAGENQFHDLALSRRQAGDSVGRGLPPGEQLARIPRLRQSALDAASSSSRPTGFSMKSEAPAFMA